MLTVQDVKTLRKRAVPILKAVSNDLKTRMKEFLVEVNESPEAHKDRDPNRVSASEVWSVCPRWAVLRRQPEFEDEVIRWGPTMYGTFGIGKAVERWLREDVLGPMGVLLGTWICNGCGTKIEGKKPRLGECGSAIQTVPGIDYVHRACRGTWRFQEKRIFLSEYGVPGSYDGVIALDNERLCDIKSEDPEMWKQLQGPRPKHTTQLTSYMKAEGYDEGMLIYVNKSTGDTKIYVVPLLAHNLAGIGTFTKMVYSTEDGMTISRPKTCLKPTQMMAIRCPARHKCYPNHRFPKSRS